jgi:hypothetical protein
MPKMSINNISSVCFVFRAANPRELFLEVKDDGHPIPLVHGQLCPIGGNWIGADAVADKGPLDTIRRELKEELTLDRPMRETGEMVSLGLADQEIAPQQATPIAEVTIDPLDLEDLEFVKLAISEGLQGCGSGLNTVTAEAMLAANPASTRETFTTLSCYWVVMLDEEPWHKLVALQNKFGNLSCEAVTRIITLKMILAEGLQIAFAHDEMLRTLFQRLGCADAKNIPHVAGTETALTASLVRYQDYLERYNIARTPLS